MNQLGIKLQEAIRDKNDVLDPAFPLIAFGYYRSGFIRLALNKKRSKAKAKCFSNPC